MMPHTQLMGLLQLLLGVNHNPAGETPVTDNTVELPTFVGLRIFGRARYQPEPSGHISQFIYYPKRLPDTQLINLTK